VPGLGASFGRGASTLAQWDLVNSDCILIMGSNMAENHPIAFRFVLEARRRGATVIHADPRFTRTSALCDLHIPLRAGTDVAFLGGVINYLLTHDLWFREYAIEYTNLATIIDERFVDASQADGLFSGWSSDKREYTHETWQYQSGVVHPGIAEHHIESADPESQLAQRLSGPPEEDRSLQHAMCVYQILRRHYAAYTEAQVERITGCPAGSVERVARALAQSSGRERTAAICYAVGWTHHTNGVQMIRAASIIQGLLGNVGRPGGGIVALRGHASIQGSTDIPTLYDMLPGYLPQPKAEKPHATLAEYCRVEQTPTGWWHNFPKYIVSLLRAWYGDAASAENEWGYGWIPKITGDHSQLPMTLAMRDAKLKGLFLLGQNPVIGGSNSARVVQPGLAQLDWLVVRDFTETESASFWYASDAIRAAGMEPKDIKTEVFLLPTALAGEKAGTFTNTHRLIQWHDHVVDAPGDCRSDLWFVYHLGRRLKALYANSSKPCDAPIRNLTWDYLVHGERNEPDAAAVLREINGYTWPERKQVSGFKDLAADGSTACGCWIYSGVFPSEDDNRARSRRPDPADGPGTHLDWAFAWPSNRRTLYNRASADPDGVPWSERKRLVWWDQKAQRWCSEDEIDYDIEKSPEYRVKDDHEAFGVDAHHGTHPFTMLADGKIALFAPSGLKDAPLPTHYEPVESPVANLLYGQQNNPAVKRWHRSENDYHAVADPRFPHVLTTYRLTEHHSGASPTRSSPLTAELQPEGFAELSPQLADELDVRNLDWVTVSTARGSIEARALVTPRLSPLQIDGRTLHQVGMPWHYGFRGYATGDIVNELTSVVGDPNTSIHEGKALTCQVTRGRIARVQRRKTAP
jgi:formate dehydrogenase major subunit